MGVTTAQRPRNGGRRLEFRVLGPLEVLEGGQPLPLGGPRQRALLALLLLRANEVVSSDVLLDELWPTEPPLAGRAALRVRVSQLRKALGADVVVTRPPGYMLAAAPDRLDLHRFQRLAEQAAAEPPERAAELLREALALWRGQPLAELAYESFAQPEIARLEELRLVVLERRIDADLTLGRNAELVPELEAVVGRNPLRERPRAQLMLALYRSGRQAEALEAYQEARRALVDGLGIEPSRALHELEAAILRQDPALDPAPAVTAPEPAADRALLIVVRDPANAAALVELGGALATSPPRELIVARLVEPGGDLAGASALLGAAADPLSKRGVQARVAVFTTSTAGEDIVRLATEQDVDLLLLDAAPDELGNGFRDVLDAAPCDVGLLVGAPDAGGNGPRRGAVRRRGARLGGRRSGRVAGEGDRRAVAPARHAGRRVQRAAGREPAARERVADPPARDGRRRRASSGGARAGRNRRGRRRRVAPRRGPLSAVAPRRDRARPRRPGARGRAGAPRPEGPTSRRSRAAREPDALHLDSGGLAARERVIRDELAERRREPPAKLDRDAVDGVHVHDGRLRLPRLQSVGEPVVQPAEVP